jgi:hypothetical protein
VLTLLLGVGALFAVALVDLSGVVTIRRFQRRWAGTVCPPQARRCSAAPCLAATTRGFGAG